MAQRNFPEPNPEDILKNLEGFHTELVSQNKSLSAVQKEIELTRDKYLKLFENAPIGYFLFDESGLILDLNLTATRMLGFSRSMALHKPFILFLPSDHHRRFYYHIESALELRESQQTQLQLRRLDESRIDIHIVSIYLPPDDEEDLEDDSMVCLSAVFDVTEQNKIQHELLQSEQSYRRLFENMQDVFFRSDRTGRIQLASLSAEEWLGYSKNELLQMDERMLYVNPPLWYDFNERLYTNGSVDGFKAEFRRKNGTTFWVSINAQLYTDEHGKILGAEEIIRDISLNQETEETLDHFRQIIEWVPVPIAIFCERKIFCYLNHEGRKLFGIDSGEDERVRQSVSELFKHAVSEDSNRQLRQNGQLKTSVTFQSSRVGEIPLSLDIHSIRKDENEFIFCYFNDLRREINQKKTLRRLKSELSLSQQELNEFVSSISKELQSPLRHMQKFFRNQDLKIPRFPNESVDALEKLQKRLELLRGKAKDKIELAEVPLVSVISHVENEFGIHIHHRGKLPVVMVDPKQMNTLFLTLANQNLFHYKKISLIVLPHNRLFRIRFRLYFSKESPLKLTPETSIALSLCEKIIESHQGEFDVLIRTNKELRITFTLRAASENQTQKT